jgi:hypothetical protein
MIEEDELIGKKVVKVKDEVAKFEGGLNEVEGSLRKKDETLAKLKDDKPKLDGKTTKLKDQIPENILATMADVPKGEHEPVQKRQDSHHDAPPQNINEAVDDPSLEMDLARSTMTLKGDDEP